MCAGYNSLRPCPWRECSWDAFRIREAAGWSGCPASTPTACFADMSGRRCNGGSCSGLAAPCRNCRSTNSAWWHSTGCRRWHCPKAATCHLCTDYVPNLSTSCLCRLRAERCNRECRMYDGRDETCGADQWARRVKLIGNGERVTREAVGSRMNHEADVELTGQPRCLLVRMLCKVRSNKMLGGASRSGGWPRDFH